MTRVSWKTWPRPSITVPAAMTMRVSWAAMAVAASAASGARTQPESDRSRRMEQMIQPGDLEVPAVRAGPPLGGEVVLEGNLALGEVAGIGEVFDVFGPIGPDDA